MIIMITIPQITGVIPWLSYCVGTTNSSSIFVQIVASGPFLNRKIAQHSYNPSGLFVLAGD